MHVNLRSKFKINIKQYEIIDKIKRGGFGAVYKVKNKKDSNFYAAKIIYCTSDKENLQLIVREIDILMKCQHPTIIKMIGFSKKDLYDEDNTTIIMDLAKKGSLLSVLNGIQLGFGPSNYTNTSRQIILIGIARGMKYLHDRDIIHRDLKPDNILLDEELHPLISDFGLSKIFEYGHSQSQTKNVGTLAYMAPEVIKSSNFGRKADVYSFAILMYEVITDQKAYPDLESHKINEFQFQCKVVGEFYRPKFNFSVHEPIQNLIEQCWSDNPDERPTFKEIFNKLTSEEFYLEDVYEDELVAYIEDISKIEDNIDELNKSIDDMERDKAILQKEQQEMRDQMLRESKNWSSTKEGLMKEIAEQKEKNKNLSIEKEELLNENKRLNDEIKNLKTNKSRLEKRNNELIKKVTKIQQKQTNLDAKYEKLKEEIKQLMKIGLIQRNMCTRNSILFIGKFDFNLKSIEEQVVNINNHSRPILLKIDQYSMPDIVKYPIQGSKCDAWVLLGDVKPTMLMKDLISKVSMIIFVFNLENLETLEFLKCGWGPIIKKINKNESNRQIRLLVGTGFNDKAYHSMVYSSLRETMDEFNCSEYFEYGTNRKFIKVIKNFNIHFNLIDILKLQISADIEDEEDEEKEEEDKSLKSDDLTDDDDDFY